MPAGVAVAAMGRGSVGAGSASCLLQGARGRNRVCTKDGLTDLIITEGENICDCPITAGGCQMLHT